MSLQPQRNENGDVVPHDHPGILPEHGIIRRISDHLLIFDEKCATGRRISTAAFKDSSESNGGMSVDLQHEIEQAGHDARTYVTTPRWMGSVYFKAGQLRGEGFKIGPDPINATHGVEPNPYHGEVWGKFTKGKQNRLLQLCVWFVPIEGVSIV